MKPGTPPYLPQAACRHMDPEIFFPPSDPDGGEHNTKWRNRTNDARQACATCPEQAACLTWALDHPDTTGIWGGATDAQRSDLRRRIGHARRKAARA